MRCPVAIRDRIAISDVRWPLLLVISARQIEQSSAFVRNWLDLAHWELDHHVVRQLRIRLLDLGLDHHQSTGCVSDGMATFVGFLPDPPRHLRRSHFREQVVALN